MTWHPISTAPKDGTRVILWARQCGVPLDPWTWHLGAWHSPWGEVTINGEAWDGWDSEQTEFDPYDGSSQIKIVATHWQPLPPPPDEVKE